MEILKKILFKLLFPHIAVVIVIVPIAAALLIYAFAAPDVSNIIAFTAYFLSAYALTLLCARAPKILRRAKTFKEENKYLQKYSADPRLRVRLSLHASVAANMLYALIQLISGFIYHSVWFYAFAAYYTLLVIIRLFLLRDTIESASAKNRLKELYRYRFCGIILLIMTQALAVIVFYIVHQNRGFEYHYIHTITMAAYTFTAMTIAIINIIKYRKYESPLMSAAKAISLTSAAVSMLSLETAMLTAFGEANQANFRQLMTALTGTAVCTFVLIMAIYMIIHSNKEIKNLRKHH